MTIAFNSDNTFFFPSKNRPWNLLWYGKEQEALAANIRQNNCEMMNRVTFRNSPKWHRMVLAIN